MLISVLNFEHIDTVTFEFLFYPHCGEKNYPRGFLCKKKSDLSAHGIRFKLKPEEP